MLKKIDHMVLTTENIKEFLCFYEKLGFTSVLDGDRYALFAGDFKINVHEKGRELLPKARVVTCGSGDICFEIEGSLEEKKKELESLGVSFELGIVTRTGARGVMESAYLRDPEGNLIELCSYSSST